MPELKQSLGSAHYVGAATAQDDRKTYIYLQGSREDADNVRKATEEFLKSKGFNPSHSDIRDGIVGMNEKTIRPNHYTVRFHLPYEEAEKATAELERQFGSSPSSAPPSKPSVLKTGKVHQTSRLNLS